jgi:hypothetical protein
MDLNARREIKPTGHSGTILAITPPAVTWPRSPPPTTWPATRELIQLHIDERAL